MRGKCAKGYHTHTLLMIQCLSNNFHTKDKWRKRNNLRNKPTHLCLRIVSESEKNGKAGNDRKYIFLKYYACMFLAKNICSWSLFNNFYTGKKKRKKIDDNPYSSLQIFRGTVPVCEKDITSIVMEKTRVGCTERKVFPCAQQKLNVSKTTLHSTCT